MNIFQPVIPAQKMSHKSCNLQQKNRVKHFPLVVNVSELAFFKGGLRQFETMGFHPGGFLQRLPFSGRGFTTLLADGSESSEGVTGCVGFRS